MVMPSVAKIHEFRIRRIGSMSEIVRETGIESSRILGALIASSFVDPDGGMGPTGFEPVTSSVSGRHHTARLRAHGLSAGFRHIFRDDIIVYVLRC